MHYFLCSTKQNKGCCHNYQVLVWHRKFDKSFKLITNPKAICSTEQCYEIKSILEFSWLLKDKLVISFCSVLWSCFDKVCQTICNISNSKLYIVEHKYRTSPRIYEKTKYYIGSLIFPSLPLYSNYWNQNLVCFIQVIRHW